MKRLIVLCIAFFYIIGVFHHPIISLTHADDNVISHNHGEVGGEHSHFIEEKISHDHHELEEENEAPVRKYQLKKTSQTLSIQISGNVIEFGNDYFLLDNKNLVRKTSPPIVKRKIKNYSYSELTQIVISHT